MYAHTHEPPPSVKEHAPGVSAGLEAVVQRAMAKVRTQTVDTHCIVEPVFSFADRVVLQLGNGSTLDSGDIRFARGNAKLPLSADELKAKFFDCSGDDENAVRLYGLLATLETLGDIRSLRKPV